jgi:hypothetical protein
MFFLDLKAAFGLDTNGDDSVLKRSSSGNALSAAVSGALKTDKPRGGLVRHLSSNKLAEVTDARAEAKQPSESTFGSEAEFQMPPMPALKPRGASVDRPVQDVNPFFNQF